MDMPLDMIAIRGVDLQHMKQTPEEFTTTKLWAKTLRKIKMLSVLRGESMVRVMERLATDELERLRAEQEQATSRSAC